jgi:small subunit ribosomal protein S19e
MPGGVDSEKIFSPSMIEEIHEVRAGAFNETLKCYLKDSGKLKLPVDWDIIKTGRGRERAPEDDDWYYLRTAAVVRQLALSETVTIAAIARRYGNWKNRGVRPSKFVECDESLCCSVFDNLEDMRWVNLVSKADVTADRAYGLTDKAREIVKEIIDKVRE